MDSEAPLGSSTVHNLPPFAAPYGGSDADIAAPMPAQAAGAEHLDGEIAATARGLIEAIRRQHGGLSGIEDLLREYALTTEEGLALMVLAEALLRIPDAATADRLVEDHLGHADPHYLARFTGEQTVSVNTAAIGGNAALVALED